MKILVIRGNNLASLDGEFELSLVEGPLAQAGVFAICGPTGAGKSTLLDAMCLALFDTAPRLDGRSRVRVGREGDDDARITTTDPRSILRQGTGGGWAEVDFLGVDEEPYRARWEVRRSRNRPDGKLQPTTMSLEALGTATRWEGRKTEVRAEIERRLGLSFDQFRRSVLLAQGDFAAFLDADPKDRADLLERMTGTAIYGEISKEAHARAGRERAALEQQEALRNAIELLEAPAREALVAKCEQLAIGVRQDELARSDAERAVRWHHEREALAREELAAREDKERVERQLALWETRRRDLAAFEAVRPLAPLLKARDGAAGRAAERERELSQAVEAVAATGASELAAAEQERAAVTALESEERRREEVRAKVERARALDERLGVASRVSGERREARSVAEQARASVAARLDALEQRSAELARDVAGHERWLAADPAGSVVADWPRTDDRLDRLVVAHARRAELEARRVAARAALDRAGADDARAEGRLLGLERTRREVEASLEQARRAIRQAPSAALVDVREGWVARRTRLETLVGVAEKAQEAHEAERRHRDRAEQALEEAARAERAGGDAGRQAAEEAVRLEVLEAQRDRVRAALDLSGHRAELVDGEACPLCGSDEHPYAHEAPMLDALAKDADERVRAAREVRRQLETRSAVAAEEAARWRSTHDEAAREAASWASALGRAREAYRATAADLGAGAWPRELPAAPGEQKDWGPLFELSGPAASGALLSDDAYAALREAREEAVEKLRAIEKTERERREREAAADELGRRWEEASRAEATAKEERADAARRLASEVHEAGVIERERDRIASELAELERSLDAALAPWWSVVEVAAVAPTVAPAVAARMAGVGGALIAGGSAPMGASVASWSEVAARSAEPFVARVRAAAAARRDRGAALEAVRVAERELAPERERVRAERAAADARCADVARASELAEAEETDVRAQRAAALEGDADEAERWSREALEAARDATGRARAALDGAKAAAARAGAHHEAVDRDLATSRAAHAEASRELDAALAASGLDPEQALSRLRLDPAEVDGWRAELERLDRERSEAEAVLAERGRKREAHELGDPPKLDADAAARRRDEATKRVEQTRELLHAARGRIERDDVERQRAASLDAAVAEARATVDVWLTLSDLIGSATGNKLRVFAQSLTLELLLEHANHHLSTLARRYALQRVPGEDLALQVVDHEMGGEVRAVGSLSGGESFLVALGLALGLASLSSERARVDSLFIDEGFGALDPSSLETVLGTLDMLQAGGRQVGLISHVPIIAERFETRVQVVPAGPARSMVALVSPA
ncbi:MAG: AAA family ATPase [Sandaracinaceae bacterium]|nr:AAA family ATPase [Sandaracinaceae bacterium]